MSNFGRGFLSHFWFSFANKAVITNPMTFSSLWKVVDIILKHFQTFKGNFLICALIFMHLKIGPKVVNITGGLTHIICISFLQALESMPHVLI